MASKIPLNPSWSSRLSSEFQQEYMQNLKKFLLEDQKKNTIYPPAKECFQALDVVEFKDVKACILGQDPYHGEGQAHGLSFSVKKHKTPPPSLVNIYKELKSDLNIPIASHGYLLAWARQGVLMLNSTLTVRRGQPASHRDQGWEQFTDKIISILSKEREDIVFLLWGRFATQKAELIDASKHCILTSPHPSPFSAHQGFFGCKHFSKANAYLESKGISPIDWSAHLKD